MGLLFFNMVFPFIRYRTGDIVEFTNQKCSCGRTSRVIDSIDGRQEDFVELPNGAKIGRLDHLFKGMTSVVESQVVQYSDLSRDFRIVRSKGYSGDCEKNLNEKIKSLLGSNVVYDFVYCEKIPRGKNGKLRFVVKEKERSGFD
ncbi:MAG: hypothetical protein MPJ24_10300 [Pirellulaceae bacterium]|nr:hypothetical protein [Pirellulaceae bacterium]